MKIYYNKVVTMSATAIFVDVIHAVAVQNPYVRLVQQVQQVQQVPQVGLQDLPAPRERLEQPAPREQRE